MNNNIRHRTKKQGGMMIDIRSLRKNDRFDDLISLSHTFFGEYEAYHADFFKIDDLKDEAIINFLTHLRDTQDGDVIIALDGNRVVGYITINLKTQSDHWTIKKVGNISGLMVHPAYRRMGIASRLLEKATEFFNEASVKYFTVYTAVKNINAVTFYERNGLAPLHTTFIGETEETVDENKRPTSVLRTDTM